LHSGAGVVVDGNYTGIDVHRAARIGAAAHGGQIVISAPSRELLGTSSDVMVTDLGWFELKGLSRPEHLYQATASGLPANFPQVQARPSFRAGLPRELTPLFGRESDIAAIALLLDSTIRLLTLIGPGGMGKTRLAVAVARRIEDRYRDGVGFISLAAVTDPEQVDVTVVMGLGRTVEGTASAEDVIVDELRERQFLLVLDNFEQVVDRAPLLRSLLERLPDIQILVTSRIALQLSVEREYGVAPLQLPESGAGPGGVADAAAVRLLVDRARAVRPDLAVTADNAEAVAELVRRLDGIPLAIELAAARLRLLEPADFLSRLRSALDLESGAVDLPPRQRTLRAAIDSSYNLLAPSEQLLFGRLGVFVDGWTLAAAEAVTGDPGATEVAAALDTLAAHSLIQLETLPGAGVRMRLLVPLQDYCRALLEESGEPETIRVRHAAFYAGIVEGYPRGSGVGMADWRRRMELEWGNIQQAIHWCVDRLDYSVLARFLVSLWPLLWQEDRIDESLGWLEVLRPHFDELEPSLRAQTFHVDGFFALEAGDFERALEGGQRAMEAAAALGDEEIEANSRLVVAGSLPAFDFDDPRIPELIVEAIRVFRNRGDTVNLAYALNFLGSYQAGRGDLAEARKAVEEAVLLSARIEALPIGAQSSSLGAFVELISGDLDRAKVYLDAARTALAVTPSREVLSYILDGYGWWALAKGREIDGLSALGAAEGLRARIGLRVWPLAAVQISLLARMADSYEDPEAQAARRAGRELTPDAALALVAGSEEAP
ncbi:MAG TPA: NB-ARC domain-containing protein, partial [Acidimicrobiia bacterium]|nr:NB-ARC domain-containing protein [Acidimicrobiia bacterium]